MAGLAIGCSGCLMAEGRIRPVIRVMACRTLSGEMIGGFIIPVAGLAIRGTGCLMAEGGVGPVRRVVASGTLPSVMVGRSVITVAGLAVRGTCCQVIKAGRYPGSCIVACRADAIVVLDWLVQFVADKATHLNDHTVINVNLRPCSRQVAGGTLTIVMDLWHLIEMAIRAEVRRTSILTLIVAALAADRGMFSG